MKKILTVLLVITIVMGLTACGEKETNNQTNAKAGQNESTETEKEPSDDETYVLRMAIVTSQSHTHNQSIKNWAEQVKEETNGRLEIRLLDNGSLGGERDYIEGMKLGTIDMAQVSSAVVANFLPNFSVMSLPYVFDSYESIGDIVNGEIGTALFEDLESINIVGLTWFSNGFRSVFTNVENVTKPEDLNGVKIRVMESAVMIDTLNAMGASATPMAYSELYTAIQQGVLDGGENAPGNILNDKFYEISKQLSLTEHFATPGVVAISKKSFDKLPADLQEYLKESAQELGVAERELDKINQLKAVEELIENGVVVTEVDKEAFKEAVLPLYSTATEDIDPKILELLKETLNIEF